MFFDALTSESIVLAEVGITVKISDGVSVVRPVYVSKCSVDIVAKYKLPNNSMGSTVVPYVSIQVIAKFMVRKIITPFVLPGRTILSELPQVCELTCLGPMN